MVIVLRVLPERGKVIPATPSYEPCELQYQPARQDMFTDSGDGGSQQLSCCVLGPFHRRNPNFVEVTGPAGNLPTVGPYF